MAAMHGGLGQVLAHHPHQRPPPLAGAHVSLGFFSPNFYTAKPFVCIPHICRRVLIVVIIRLLIQYARVSNVSVGRGRNYGQGN